MLTIWRCVSPSIPDHNYSYGPVWTATLYDSTCGRLNGSVYKIVLTPRVKGNVWISSSQMFQISKF